MKVLVAAAFYPTVDGRKNLYYIHSRNLYYIKSGIEVTVLNFSADKSYTIDGIDVISLKDYVDNDVKFDMLVCHAANLRNHYRFLQKYGMRFTKKVFVFHGHEVLHFSKYYPKPYSFVRERSFKKHLQNMYDSFKISMWKKYYLSNIDNIRLVFVSNWIFRQFLAEMKCGESMLKRHYTIISNSVGEYFEINDYKPLQFKYDFITIRGNLDGSKYGIDVVVKLANEHPQFRFCIIGKGKYFEFRDKPHNITVIPNELSHIEMREYINSSKYALFPTREDTQGLMACELATYGIPLITSNIDVCTEVFADCPNVAFINNDNPDLEKALSGLNDWTTVNKWTTYFARNTIMKEIDYLKKYNM